MRYWSLAYCHPLLAVLLLLGFLRPLNAQQVEGKPKITVTVTSDYLALHVTASAPAEATAWEYQLSLPGNERAVGTGVWLPLPQAAPVDGGFRFDVPLPEWRWTKLEVRATANGAALSASATPEKREFKMLTAERINELPEAPQTAWHAYLEISGQHAEHERDVLASECRKLGMAAPKVPQATKVMFQTSSSTPADWYGTADAFKLAQTILSYQTRSGAWSKAIDYTAGLRAQGTQWTINPSNPWHYCGTLDNRSTTEQIRFLANVFNATGREDAKAGALHGLEWILTAQYPNGGWPQNYPVEPGYHEAITLNDDAMLHAMELLLAVSKGEAPFAFVDGSLRERAATAYDGAIACLLACQVKVNDKLTVWCAQHDPVSLEPVAARLKEPPSLSGAESADLLKFLMRKGPVTPAVVTAVESALEWLSAHRVTGLRKVTDANGKPDYVEDAASDEVYWARFYDVQSGLPIFAGAQDGKIYSTFHEMAQHNQVAYDYFSLKPAEVLGKEADRWRERVKKTQP